MAKTASNSFNPYLPTKSNSNVMQLVAVAKTLAKKHKIKGTIPFNQDDFNKFTWLDPEVLYVNFDAQRWPDDAHIGKLVNNFDPMLCTPLVCVYRTDLDQYRVCDGLQHGSGMIATYLGCLANGLKLPVWYAEADSEYAERKIFLALNRDNLPMAKYFIHVQEVGMKVAKAVEIERVVKAAGAFTAYKGSKAGSITHISDLYLGHKSLGAKCLGLALHTLRTYFSEDKIHTASMLGIGKVFFLLDKEGLLTKEIIDEVGEACFANFEDSDRLHLDIKEQFEKDYPTNYKGMGAMEKVASGIIDTYNQHFNKDIGIPQPFAITMPLMV